MRQRSDRVILGARSDARGDPAQVEHTAAGSQRVARGAAHARRRVGHRSEEHVLVSRRVEAPHGGYRCRPHADSLVCGQCDESMCIHMRTDLTEPAHAHRVRRMCIHARSVVRGNIDASTSCVVLDNGTHSPRGIRQSADERRRISRSGEDQVLQRRESHLRRVVAEKADGDAVMWIAGDERLRREIP